MYSKYYGRHYVVNEVCSDQQHIHSTSNQLRAAEYIVRTTGWFNATPSCHDITLIREINRIQNNTPHHFSLIDKIDGMK